ncbi:hypothetical protein V2J09_007063 [Rumex salicifolius]
MPMLLGNASMAAQSLRSPGFSSSKVCKSMASIRTMSSPPSRRQRQSMSAFEARVSLVLALASHSASASQRLLADLVTETAKYVFPRKFETRNLEEALMSVPDLESFNYKILCRNDRYEIREVEPYFIAETTMPGKSGFEFNGSSQSFNALAEYLFGKNVPQEKMEMTMPVITRKTSSVGERMEMTTPVITRKTSNQEKWQMSFVMPSKYGSDLPLPNNPSVRITEVPKKIVAVVAFSGFVTDEEVTRRESTLRAALKSDIEFQVKNGAQVEVAQMSLYIGNLSPRVGKDELEHAFGRFGRCSIRLKDGYGFAIYGIRAQAEVALRALRGRKICGLPISLSWSNKQPNAPQSFNRGGRQFDTQPGRGFGRRDDHMNGPLRSNACQQYKFRQPDSDAKRLKSDLPVEKESTDHVSEELEGVSQKEDGHDRSDNIDHNMLDSGRWGEFGPLSHDSHIEDGTTFDRYEPDREYERTGQEGGNMSPGKEISEDKLKREEAVDVASRHQNIQRKNQACFKCGNLGHKMRDCPLQDASRVRKLAHSNDRRGRVMNSRRADRIDPDGAEPSSRKRLSSTSTKERVRGRKDSGSGRHQRVKRRRSSPVSTEYSDRGKAHGRREQSEDENENFRHRRGKRTKRSLSRSRSRSSSASSSRSNSTSRSSVSSRLTSKRNGLKTRLSRSRSRSRSRSPTSLSLSVSLGQPLPFPPNKTEVNLNGYLDVSTSLQTKPDVVQENQKLEVVAEEDIIGIDVQSNLILMQENQQLEVVSKEENDASGDTRVAMQEENLDICADVEDDLKIDQLQKNDDKYLDEARISDGKNQHTAFLEDEHVTLVGSPYVLREESELQTLGAESYVPMKSDSKITYMSRANHKNISMDELDRVMKHYNMKHPDESGGYLSIEDYFGCARLWPWEMIFYRRLKKGPISTENYARRLAQNKEFGINDKYVRSSSGWGELIEEL